jgi:FAD:protein FMN transferase
MKWCNKIFFRVKSGSCNYILFILLCLGREIFSSYKEIARNDIRIDLQGFAQGTTWHITYYSTDSAVTKRQVDSILIVIDSSLSIYKQYSRIVAFNNSDSGIAIDKHFQRVVQKSLDTYNQTNGLFDITVFPLVEIWGFGAKPFQGIPDSGTIRTLLSCVGSNYLKLKKSRLIKSKPCVKIDVNGIAQGYTVDVIADFLEKKRVRNYIVELGGEIRVHGKKQPEKESFTIGIEAPSENESEISLMQKILVMDGGAITTSGNYRKYYESKGRKISHIIDPRTGYSSQNELISVTVYAKNAITADAYDNALMIMGLEKALKFIEKRKDLAAYFIYHQPNGTVADTASSRFYRLIKQ